MFVKYVCTTVAPSLWPDVPTIGFPGFLKAVMKMTGMDLGPPRLPMLPISPDAYKRLQSELKDIGFFDWS